MKKHMVTLLIGICALGIIVGAGTISAIQGNTGAEPVTKATKELEDSFNHQPTSSTSSGNQYTSMTNIVSNDTTRREYIGFGEPMAYDNLSLLRLASDERSGVAYPECGSFSQPMACENLNLLRATF